MSTNQVEVIGKNSRGFAFLTQIMDYAESVLKKHTFPRGQLKYQLVTAILKKLQQDPQNANKSSTELLLMRLDTGIILPGQGQYYSLADALNFHRHWFGRGDTTSYTKFIDQPITTVKEQMLLFLDNTMQRLKREKGQNAKLKFQYLGSVFDQLKTSKARTSEEILQIQFDLKIKPGGPTQQRNLLNVLLYHRKGNNTLFENDNPITAAVFRRLRKPKSYTYFVHRFRNHIDFSDQVVCNLLNTTSQPVLQAH